MPWRLIEFIVIFAILFLFIIFNLGDKYKCDINFGFKSYPDVPVFITVFSSFFIGMLCTLPFIFASKARRKAKAAQGKGLLAKASKKQSKDAAGNSADSGLFDKNHYGID